MERLHALVGRESDIDESARRLYGLISEQRPPQIGAMLVTCADESERECGDAFQRNVSEYLLPSLKFGERSHFRIANLGGRYETGAVQIATSHYATSKTRDDYLLMLIKINSHVSVEPYRGGYRFGSMRRYDTRSTYCGALHALIDGERKPFVDELARSFRADGKDRVAMLTDERRVIPSHRYLFAAVTNASIQAERVVEEILDVAPPVPTMFLVLACVTLNRARKDGEIVCGVHQVDRRLDPPTVAYHGLGADPSSYRLTGPGAPLLIEQATR